MLRLAVGGAIPPEDVMWFDNSIDQEFNCLQILEDFILETKWDVISVGRDSYKIVFDILKKYNINNIPIGIHSKASITDVKCILDEIKENDWQEYCDDDLSFDGRYKQFTKEISIFKI